MTNTMTDIDLIRCRLKAMESDIDMVQTILQRIEQRHRGKP
jgi:hypothetical protein